VIAIGSGQVDELMLSHVPDTADIRAGDLLVTSGLAGRFPKGYPVAEVSTVRHEPGKPFATVSARPLAQLERSRYVLMLNPLEATDNTDLSVTGSVSPETKAQE